MDAAVTAQQGVAVAGGGTLMLSIPALPGSTSNISVDGHEREHLQLDRSGRRKLRGIHAASSSEQSGNRNV
jgi:hypothetical protein